MLRRVSMHNYMLRAYPCVSTGHAALFVDRILREEARTAWKHFSTWNAFRATFIEEFLPKNEVQHALTWLETTLYHQDGQSMDEYIDKFRDLIDQAGYHEGLTIVMKFCKGLWWDIQDQIVTLANGCPDNADPNAWYIAALNCAENIEMNQLFCKALPTLKDNVLTHLHIAPVMVPHEFDVWHMTWERYEEWKALQRDMTEIACKEKEAAFVEVQPQHCTGRQASTQTLPSTPLVWENRFTPLKVEEVPMEVVVEWTSAPCGDEAKEIETSPTSNVPQKIKKARWERKLLHELT
jgi:hypothetical protein